MIKLIYFDFVSFFLLVTDVPSDNVYAYALSKTLTKVSSPVTVGLYSECHNRINMVLKNIEGKQPHLFIRLKCFLSFACKHLIVLLLMVTAHFSLTILLYSFNV